MKGFLREIDRKQEVDDAEVLVDGAPWLQPGLHELGIHFRHEPFAEGNLVERVIQEVKRRTEPFDNWFSHAQPETVESWLQALARALKTLI